MNEPEQAPANETKTDKTITEHTRASRMSWDLEARAWWVFQLPGGGVVATAYVPAESEAAAREHMSRSSYNGAPVHAWPLIGTRFTSRAELRREMAA